jgi:uncharacterized protein
VAAALGALVVKGDPEPGFAVDAPRIVRADAVPPQAWRNGGGETRELLTWPPGCAGGDSWRLRISLADIRADGPFSAYPGITRWFAVVAGAGVVLTFGERAVRLTAGAEPITFAGAAAPDCRLVAGPTRDLNLMHRDGRATLHLASKDQTWRGDFAQRGLFTTVAGELSGDSGVVVPLPAYSLWWEENSGGALRFRASGAEARGFAWWLGYSPDCSDDRRV